MRSVKSFFNAGLLRKDLSRCWPLWALYTVLWLLALPVAELMELTHPYRGTTVMDLRSEVLYLIPSMGLGMAVVFGALLAMALFSYLCSPRSVSMMHSFPIRREGLFLTHYAAGLLMLFSAHILTFAVTAAVQGICGGYVAWRALGTWLAAVTCLALFFFTFAVFCAMFTGQILAIPVFYGVLNVLAVGLEYLVRAFAEIFFYGAALRSPSLLSQKLSPAVYLSNHLSPEYEIYETQGYLTSVATGRLNGMDALLWYAAAAVVLAVLALLVYRRRRSESAGDTVAVSWAGWIFRYGVGLCCALSLGQALYYLVLGNYLSQAEYSLAGVLFCMLLMGLLGYFAAEMLMRKTFRVLRRSWKGAVVLSAVLVAFGVTVSLDLTGYEARIPDAGQITSIEYDISGFGTYAGGSVDRPEDVELLLAAHQALIGEKQLQKERSHLVQGQGDYVNLWMKYHLDNGKTLSRRYEAYCLPEDREREDSALSRLEAFAGTETVLRSYVMENLSRQETVSIVGGALDFPRSSTVSGDWSWNTVEMDSETAREVFRAMEEDIKAGRFRFSLLGEDAPEQYSNSFYLYYSCREEDGSVTSSSSWIRGFGPQCTATIAALEEAGILDQEHRLMTDRELSRDWNGDAAYEEAAAELPVTAVTVDTALKPLETQQIRAQVG